MIDTKRPVGRPAGSLSDPEATFKNELGSWVKISRQLRGIIEKQIDAFDILIDDIKAGRKNADIDTQLKIADGLSKLIKTANDIVVSSIQDKGPKPQDLEDPDKILESLKGGSG